MKRRDFIALLGGAAAWPLAARAQQGERMRRIGVLMPRSADDPEGQAASRRSCKACSNLGWTVGRNVQIDIRWAAGDADRIRKYAAELVALAPDVILAAGTAVVGPLLQVTRTVPIVFVDRPRSGRRRLRRQPGATGRQRHRLHAVRIRHEREMAGAAQGDRAARDASGCPSGSSHSAGIGQFGAIQSVAPSLGVEVSPINVRDAGEIERASRPSRSAPNGGLIVTAEPRRRRSSRSDHRAGGPAQAARGLLSNASSSPPAA